ncbi:MAG TPA: hypothetical protein VGM34_02290 [Chlamydiales bacterium]|jgi:hypothetical protein
MKRHLSQELPIRSKLVMAQEIAEIIVCLHRGDRRSADRLIEELKSRAIYFDESVQTDVLMFAEQVQFQSTYDPSHGVTPEVEKAANRLLESLGWTPPDK